MPQLSATRQGEAATLGRRSEDGMEDASVDTVMEAEGSRGPGVGDTDTALWEKKGGYGDKLRNDP